MAGNFKWRYNFQNLVVRNKIKNNQAQMGRTKKVVGEDHRKSKIKNAKWQK